MAGFKYGLFIASLMFALDEWAPQPTGSMVLWTLLAALMLRSLWVASRRLRLPWLAAGGAAGFLVSLAMIPISARGLNVASIATELPLVDVAAIWSALLFVPLCVGLESLRESPEWRAWSARTEHATFWELVTLRHAPRARAANQPSNVGEERQ
jgi:hypothetical protein